MESEEKEVLLPQSEAELDSFVEGIVKDFGLPAGDDTYDAIATMIMHLDHKIAHRPRSYFANGVRKMLANKAAYTRLRELAEKRKAKEEAEAKEKTGLTLVENEVPPVGAEPVQNA